MLYRHNAPSNTSLSDDFDEEDPSIPDFSKPDQPLFPLDATVHPHWSALAVQPRAKRASNGTIKSPISTLPPELLITTLKYLTSSRDILSALKVSRKWCECAVELLWHRIIFNRYSTLEKMARLLRRSKQTFPYAQFIRRLNFINLGSELRDDTLAVFSRCIRLERLTLTNSKHITPTVLESTLTSFPDLIAVDLSGVVETTSEVVTAFASVAKRLQGINLSGCHKVTDSALVALGANCPLLRRVKLSGLTLVTDVGVSAIVEQCPLLLELDLHQCENITDSAVRKVWIHSTNMREMRLSLCTNLTDLAFPVANPIANPFATNDSTTLPPLHIARSFDALRLLDLTSCAHITDDAVEGIIAHAPKIRNLVLAKCVLLTDRSLEAICGLGKHLNYLHLGHASNITDAAVKTLARTCLRIRYIDFANCTKLTDASVSELSALPKLRRIGLVRVTNLTDDAIFYLGERHATLERIHLSYCDQISVRAVHFLLLKLHKLTHLSLSGVPAFRQPDIQRYCRDAPKEFTAAQRQNFCVFSGKGISHLRTFLTQYYDHITEQDGTDDTEPEDEDYFPRASQHDITPEAETGEMAGNDNAAGYHVIGPNQHPLPAPFGRESRGANPDGNNPQSFHFSLHRDQRRAMGVINGLPQTQAGGSGVQGEAAVQGAMVRLSQLSPMHIDGGEHTVRGRTPGPFPIMEPASPDLQPGVTPSAFSEMGAAFLPDNMFAPVEAGGSRHVPIGHEMRRGPPGSSRVSDYQTPPYQDNGQAALSLHYEQPGTQRAMSESDGDMFVGDPSNPYDDVDRRRHAESGPPPELRHSREHRHRSMQSGSASGSSRGRSVRRTLRNGLNAAESLASNFLFGRPWTEDGVHPRSAPTSATQPRPQSPQNQPASAGAHTHWFSGR